MNAPVRYKVGLMAKVFPTVRTWEDFFASTVSGRSNGAGEFDGISGDRQNACRAKDDLDILGDTVFLRRHQCNVIMFCFTVWRWSKAHFQDVLIFVSINPEINWSHLFLNSHWYRNLLFFNNYIKFAEVHGSVIRIRTWTSLWWVPVNGSIQLILHHGVLVEILVSV